MQQRHKLIPGKVPITLVLLNSAFVHKKAIEGNGFKFFKAPNWFRNLNSLKSDRTLIIFFSQY